MLNKHTVILMVMMASECALCELCPNGRECPNRSVCCKLVDGTFGCCPYSNGICCEDRIHCCPQGQTCNLKSQRCDNNLLSLLSRREMAFPEDFSGDFRRYNVITPDNAYAKMAMIGFSEESEKASRTSNQANLCPDGSTCVRNYTCCQIPKGTYGCCPYSLATCCVDGVHCCPNGFKCKLQEDRCIQNSYQSVKSRISEQNVCPDHHVCPTKSTCCNVGTGKYGCCPYPKATCCADKLHCCPAGYICNLKSRTCIPKSNFELLLTAVERKWPPKKWDSFS